MCRGGPGWGSRRLAPSAGPQAGSAVGSLPPDWPSDPALLSPGPQRPVPQVATRDTQALRSGPGSGRVA